MKKQSIILLVFCMVTGSLSKPPPTFLEYKDSLGQYSFGYSAPSSARSEVRSLDGSTRGSYSYVDDTGVIQSVQYTADEENGFQVIATNLPKAPSAIVDTPEVVAARLEHLKALENAAKLVDEIPGEEVQRDSKIDGKDIDTIVVENVLNSVENKMGSEVQEKSVNSEIETKSSAETENKKLGEKKEAVMVKMESMQDTEKAVEDGSMPIKSQRKSAVQSNVPVVTTSFVIPGTVDLQNRIELDQSGVPATRLYSEYSAPSNSQPSMLQASEFDPSMMTPAATKMMMMSSNERENMLMKMTPLSDKSMPSNVDNSHNPQPYSTPFVPRVVTPSNIIAVPYAFGSNPIYPQYNPYQYFHFGVL